MLDSARTPHEVVAFEELDGPILHEAGTIQDPFIFACVLLFVLEDNVLAGSVERVGATLGVREWRRVSEEYGDQVGALAELCIQFLTRSRP